MKIPFNIPYKSQNQEDYVLDSLRSKYLAGDGSYTKKSEEYLTKLYSGKQVLLTNSCTAALEMAALLCDFNENDEVILPSFTFVSTANAFALRGAKIVFCDISDQSYCLDPIKCQKLITSRTKAIVTVNYAGNCFKLEELRSICDLHNLILIEDAAQSIFSFFNGRPIGTFGDLSTLSFHETKNIHCGEGGALIINNPKFSEKAEIIREKGTNRKKFIRGQVDKYSWVDLGSSYLMPDYAAAFLLAQLEECEQATIKRLSQYNYYYNQLSNFAYSGGIQLPCVTEGCMHNGHIFSILLESHDIRNRFIESLMAKNIQSVFHYIPLHSSPFFSSKYNGNSLCTSSMVSDTIVRLPMYVGVDVEHVVEEVQNTLEELL